MTKNNEIVYKKFHSDSQNCTIDEGLEIFAILKDKIKSSNIFYITAPQLGIYKNVSCINFSLKNNDPMLLINLVVDNAHKSIEKIGNIVETEEYGGELVKVTKTRYDSIRFNSELNKDFMWIGGEIYEDEYKFLDMYQRRYLSCTIQRCYDEVSGYSLTEENPFWDRFRLNLERNDRLYLIDEKQDKIKVKFKHINKFYKKGYKLYCHE